MQHAYVSEHFIKLSHVAMILMHFFTCICSDRCFKSVSHLLNFSKHTVRIRLIYFSELIQTVHFIESIQNSVSEVSELILWKGQK